MVHRDQQNSGEAHRLKNEYSLNGLSVYHVFSIAKLQWGIPTAAHPDVAVGKQW